MQKILRLLVLLGYFHTKWETVFEITFYGLHRLTVGEKHAILEVVIQAPKIKIYGAA